MVVHESVKIDIDGRTDNDLNVTRPGSKRPASRLWELYNMSQRQEEMRERLQEELYDELKTRSQPLRDQISQLERQRADLDAQIAEAKQKISDMYEANKEFLTKL